MTYILHIQKKAQKDLINVWRYGAETRGAEQADSYLDELEDKLSLLIDNPQLGVACDYIKKGYRQLHIKSHMVFYRISGNKIRIIRVLREEMLFTDHL